MLAPRPLACLTLAITLTLSGCGNSAAPTAQKSPTPVGIVIIKAQTISVATELPGRTSPYLISEIRPQIGGIILQRLFREGGEVKVGEALYQIDPTLYKSTFDSARANLAKSEANRATLKLKEQRYQELVKINAVSQQEYDDANGALKQAEADVAANKAALETARINLNYTRITSPISGRTGISTVTPGALVTANQPMALTTVQRIDPIYVDVTQSSADLLRMKKALEGGLLKRASAKAAKAQLVLDDNSHYAMEGELAFSDVTVNQGTGTVTLRALFPNPKGDLLPGMFVRAVIEEGINEQGILVPQQGVTRNARGQATALVLGADGKVVLRPLNLGEAVGNKWVVKSGLSVGEQLIVDGLQKVKPGASAVGVPVADVAALKTTP